MLLSIFGALICILVGDHHGWPEDQSDHNISLGHTFFFLCTLFEVIDLVNFIGNLATSQISITNLMFINTSGLLPAPTKKTAAPKSIKSIFLFFVFCFIR
jgi:hypothetical protein